MKPVEVRETDHVSTHVP